MNGQRNEFPGLPEPTGQEIQESRMTLSPHLKGLTDDQLRTTVDLQKQDGLYNNPQAQQAIREQQQQQQPYIGMRLNNGQFLPGPGISLPTNLGAVRQNALLKLQQQEQQAQQQAHQRAQVRFVEQQHFQRQQQLEQRQRDALQQDKPPTNAHQRLSEVAYLKPGTQVHNAVESSRGTSRHD